MKEEEAELLRKSDSGCVLSMVELAFFRDTKDDDIEQRYRELRANDIKASFVYPQYIYRTQGSSALSHCFTSCGFHLRAE